MPDPEERRRNPISEKAGKAHFGKTAGPVFKLIIAAMMSVGPDKGVGVHSKYDTLFKRLESSGKAEKKDANG